MSWLYFPAFDDSDLDDHEAALAGYLLRLEFLAPRLDRALSDALAAWQASEEIAAALHGEYDAMVTAAVDYPGAAFPIVYTPGMAAAEVRIEAHRLEAESAAGALLLMLDEVIQGLRLATMDSRTGEPPYPKHASEFALGALGADDSVSTLIYAAGNAYRHANDWLGLVDGSGVVDESHVAYGRARRTINLLNRSIDLARVSERSTCVASVERLTHGDAGRSSFETLWEHLRDVGRDYARTYAQGSSSFDRAVAALAAQHEYARIPASFSGDEKLWASEASIE